MTDTRTLPRIVVIEDDAVVAETLTLYLEHAGYAVVAAADGREGLALARQAGVAVVILDLMIPGMSGQQVCRALRETSRVPILMLTARTSEDDRVAGLEMGADDYVPKPFSPREVVARVQALLRRAGEPSSWPAMAVPPVSPASPAPAASKPAASTPGASAGSAVGGESGAARLTGSSSSSDVLRAGALEIDRWSRQVRVSGHLVTLTRTELRLLEALARHPGRTFTRDELVARAFGPDYDGLDRTIDTHITNLRRKLDPGGERPAAERTGSADRLRTERMQSAPAAPGSLDSPLFPDGKRAAGGEKGGPSSEPRRHCVILTVHGIGYKLAADEDER